MKHFMLAMLLAGTALLGVILYQTDLTEVWSRLLQVSGWGLAAILLAYLGAFLGETGSWLLTLPRAPVTPRWLYRFWKVLMVGSAIENVTPLASMGGEPIKAVALKQHYAIPYREATASLVLTRTTDVIAQVVFIAIGFLLMVRADLLPPPYRLAAGSGLVLLAVGILFFFLVQRHRAFSRMRHWLERGWLAGRRLSRRALIALEALHDVEDRLVAFYTSERRRFALSVAVAFAGWCTGALATYLAVNGLGEPIDYLDAFAIEAFVVLVRSTLFFVPGDLGTQEGAQVLICAGLTGSPELGLALGAIRRARDILWILWGLAIGSHYSLGGRMRNLGAVR